MPDVSAVAILAATAAAFLLSGAWYAVFGSQLAIAQSAGASDAAMPPWKVAVELLRTLVLAAAVAGLASRADVEGVAGALLLAVVLWLAFPVVLWIGAMIHEGTPWRLAAIHGSDWLAKLVIVAVIVSV